MLQVPDAQDFSNIDETLSDSEDDDDDDDDDDEDEDDVNAKKDGENSPSNVVTEEVKDTVDIEKKIELNEKQKEKENVVLKLEEVEVSSKNCVIPSLKLPQKLSTVLS